RGRRLRPCPHRPLRRDRHRRRPRRPGRSTPPPCPRCRRGRGPAPPPRRGPRCASPPSPQRVVDARKLDAPRMLLAEAHRPRPGLLLAPLTYQEADDERLTLLGQLPRGELRRVTIEQRTGIRESPLRDVLPRAVQERALLAERVDRGCGRRRLGG